jgi:hypothetical protein
MKIETVLDTLGPAARQLWEHSDEVGRVSMALTISEAVRKQLGDAKANIAFAIMFTEAKKPALQPTGRVHRMGAGYIDIPEVSA